MEIAATHLIPYLTTIIGFLIVYVLNGIKSEIKEVKTSVKNLEEDIRAEQNLLTQRVTKLEAGCAYMHHRKDL